ncbi:MAG: VWA domain-containing protein [Candidatus Hydrogenedentes bacterium]|nr:VWA domain-containing protein [Candidatus Hydrogenedentota bacterium]
MASQKKGSCLIVDLGGSIAIQSAKRRKVVEQTPFSDVTFADNPEQRCPSLLLLDVSGSMAGEPITELQAGLEGYCDELAADPLARKRVEIGIVTFGGPPRVVQPFSTADAVSVPQLQARGDTPMGQAVNMGLSLLDERKKEYKQHGIPYYRPWVFLITDGAPTDDSTPAWQEAVARLRTGQEERAFLFFAVGVERANMDVLKQLSVSRDPLKLKGLRFRDLFSWLSNSQQAVSRSISGETVPLEDPTGPTGWGEVNV